MKPLTHLSDLDELDAAIAESLRSARPAVQAQPYVRGQLRGARRAVSSTSSAPPRAPPTSSSRSRAIDALSDELAARFGIRHETPQAILLRDGVPVWTASHFRITAHAPRYRGRTTRTSAPANLAGLKSLRYWLFAASHNHAAPRTPLESPCLRAHERRGHVVREHEPSPQPWNTFVQTLDVRHSAAQHDDVRIDDVDDRGERAREAPLVTRHRGARGGGRRRRRARQCASRPGPHPSPARDRRDSPGPDRNVSMQPVRPQ